MPEPGRAEHQCRVAVREGAHDSGASPDLPHDPLQGIIRSDPHSMLTGKCIIRECLSDRFPYFLRCFFELQTLQFDAYSLCLFRGCCQILGGVDLE